MNAITFSGIVLALLSVACQSLENARTEVPTRELLSSNQCAVSDAKLQLIESTTEALTLTGKHRLGAQPPTLNIDHEHELMLLVAAGQKPSAGYQLQLTSHSAKLDDKTLHLPVTLSIPDQGFQATMITSPCLLLAVQRGSYRHIVVESPALELELELPEEY